MPRSSAIPRELPLSRLRSTWKKDPEGVAIDLLRLGLGAVWAINLLFIVAPTNEYFSTFQGVASGFASSSLGGPGIANLVASNATFFAWAIAVLTGYLAVAFLAGITTRLACLVGGVASLAFLLTQFTTTFVLTGGGTDVGPHPLYLLIYFILFSGGAGRYLSFDGWVWRSGRARLPALARRLCAPQPQP